MKVLEVAGSYAEMGAAQAAAWTEEAAHLFGVRWGLTQVRSRIEDPNRLRSLAEAHLPILARFHAGLHGELLAFAEASGLEPWQLVVLNHYTDFRDIPPSDGGCSVIYAPLESGPVAAQTWDMHGSAEPFVRMLRVRPTDGPAALIFTITGCMGMCGLNTEGLAVCINNLTPDDGRVGVLWPALVRKMLLQSSAAAALDVLESAELSSGHNYLIVDAAQVFDVETTGLRKAQQHSDPSQLYWHTNHYLDAGLKPLELPLHPSSTSLPRYAALCDWMAAPPSTKAALWQGLAERVSYGNEGERHRAKTCGGVLLDVKAGQVWAMAGDLREGEPVVLEVG